MALKSPINMFHVISRWSVGDILERDVESPWLSSNNSCQFMALVAASQLDVLGAAKTVFDVISPRGVTQCYLFVLHITYVNISYKWIYFLNKHICVRSILLLFWYLHVGVHLHITFPPFRWPENWHIPRSRAAPSSACASGSPAAWRWLSLVTSNGSVNQ